MMKLEKLSLVDVESPKSIYTMALVKVIYPKWYVCTDVCRDKRLKECFHINPFDLLRFWAKR